MRIWSASLAFALSISLGLYSAPAAAGAPFTVAGVSVQTRDGSVWSEGAPIVLVVRVSSPAATDLPAKALSVVMQTDGERTKCLDVAMKQVSLTGGVATYAGVFYPFRAATYDGRFGIGDDVSEIRFTVGATAQAVTSIPAGEELPVLGPVRFDYGPTFDAGIIGALAGAVAALAATALLVRRRRLAAGPALA